jgi:hypothetical protein
MEKITNGKQQASLRATPKIIQKKRKAGRDGFFRRAPPAIALD